MFFFITIRSCFVVTRHCYEFKISFRSWCRNTQENWRRVKIKCVFETISTCVLQ